jgi:hypothetical protein
LLQEFRNEWFQSIMAKLQELKPSFMNSHSGLGLGFARMILAPHLIALHFSHDGTLVSIQSFGNGAEGVSLLQEDSNFIPFTLRQASELFL